MVLTACEVSNCIRQQVHVAAWCSVKRMSASVAAVLDGGTCSCNDMQRRPSPVWSRQQPAAVLRSLA